MTTCPCSSHKNPLPALDAKTHGRFEAAPGVIAERVTYGTQFGMRIPAIYGLGYPLGALMALYIILRSTWRRGQRVEWRGRVYSDNSVRGEEKA